MESKIDVPADSVVATCIAPVNIAVVKYWGKRDEKLILPLNSSLSGTLDVGSMRSETTIIASRQFEQDQMFLNGKEENLQTNRRFCAVIRQFQNLAQDYKDPSTGNVLISKEDWPSYHLRILSFNNFPTAAGLASSASGFACLTKCLAALYNVNEQEQDLSIVARQGSGSACRSMYGGWVKWQKGEAKDGSDSKAVQIADEHHWPDMRILILEISHGPKEISSTSGMETTVHTSQLLQERIGFVDSTRMPAMEQAILNKDYATFAHETMKDSNQFHAVCLDTYPPIFYLNDTSKQVIQLIHQLNAQAGSPIAAYTFDAGPNAVIYLLAEHMEFVLSQLLQSFQPSQLPLDEFVQDKMSLVNHERLSQHLQGVTPSPLPSLRPVRSIIVTKVGPGPQILQSRHTFAQ
eukprot:TRINITY_DN798_c0_g2_i2.p1 TRINITY_DN798_c0_g2~~TRINITY_DN798_c0_g2_i2.p1  ORF type:complete len:406 (+),score=77.06 TRINITY_DN798_c0_g2_i2:64-1281(+)